MFKGKIIVKNLLFITLLFIICSCTKEDNKPGLAHECRGTYTGQYFGMPVQGAPFDTLAKNVRVSIVEVNPTEVILTSTNDNVLSGATSLACTLKTSPSGYILLYNNGVNVGGQRENGLVLNCPNNCYFTGLR
jgi:hypothetical protein